jgi:hypothetical protein
LVAGLIDSNNTAFTTPKLLSPVASSFKNRSSTVYRPQRSRDFGGEMPPTPGFREAFDSKKDLD